MTHRARATDRLVARTALGTLVTPIAALVVAAPAGAAAAKPLATELLTIGQLPAGWSAMTTGTAGGVGCLSHILEPAGVTQTAIATADFRAKAGTPELFEKLVRFSNLDLAYSKTVAAVAACHHVSGDPGGNPTTGTVSKLAFPHLGQASAAFAVHLVSAGTKVSEDFVFVRSGTTLLGLDEANLGTVGTAQFRSLAAKAVAKLS